MGKVEIEYNDDDFVMPIGLDKGLKLKDISLERLDKFLGWLEDHRTYKDLQIRLTRYLKANKYGE